MDQRQKFHRVILLHPSFQDLGSSHLTRAGNPFQSFGKIYCFLIRLRHLQQHTKSVNIWGKLIPAYTGKKCYLMHKEIKHFSAWLLLFFWQKLMTTFIPCGTALLIDLISLQLFSKERWFLSVTRPLLLIRSSMLKGLCVCFQNALVVFISLEVK